jgi:hypothetical protein
MDTTATEQTGNSTKVLILIILLGIAVSISLAFFAESLTSDSKAKRAEALPPGSDADGYGPPNGDSAEEVRLARALDAMRAALTVAEDNAPHGATPALPPAASTPAPPPPPPPAATPAATTGNGNGNGKKAAPAEGIDAKRPAPRPRPEPAATSGKPGPLPVARPAPGKGADEGDRPPSGGRPGS